MTSRSATFDRTTFDSAERALFAQLADVLIPAAPGHLSASQADVAGYWLDQVLTARPDLAAPLKALIAQAAGTFVVPPSGREVAPDAAIGSPPEGGTTNGLTGREAASFVAHLRASDKSAFGVLAEVVPGAYFMNPEVQKAIGYTGQTPREIDPHADYLDDGLLESVLSRGPIYRPTPPPG
jgi:hypothetical protein